MNTTLLHPQLARYMDEENEKKRTTTIKTITTTRTAYNKDVNKDYNNKNNDKNHNNKRKY